MPAPDELQEMRVTAWTELYELMGQAELSDSQDDRLCHLDTILGAGIVASAQTGVYQTAIDMMDAGAKPETAYHEALAYGHAPYVARMVARTVKQQSYKLPEAIPAAKSVMQPALEGVV